MMMTKLSMLMRAEKLQN